MQYDTFTLPNIQLIRSTLPEDIYNSLMSEINDIKDKGGEPWNSHLVGLIEKEYSLSKKSKDILFPFLSELATIYWFQGIEKAENVEWENDFNWVNLQKKYEYNPFHNHNGDISYVLWMDIPYKLSDEIKEKNVRESNYSGNATCFEFSFQTILGTTSYYRFPVEKGWEGRIVMFPSQLMHQVYPFQTSDDYRVSISGNLHLKKYPNHDIYGVRAPVSMDLN